MISNFESDVPPLSAAQKYEMILFDAARGLRIVLVFFQHLAWFVSL